jgi:dihydroorotase
VCADVSVLNDDRGRWVLQDNEKTQVIAERMFTPAFCLRAGERFDADASILPVAQAA